MILKIIAIILMLGMVFIAGWVLYDLANAPIMPDDYDV